MNDDPRSLRILLTQTQFDLSQAIFQLGEAQKALADANTQLAEIAAKVGDNQQYAPSWTGLRAHLPQRVDTAPVVPPVVTAQTPAGTAQAPQTPQKGLSL